MAESTWITGGAGFLGSRVVKRLTSDGHQVHCLVRTKATADSLLQSLPPANASMVNIVLGSLNDAGSCRELVSKGTRGFHIASSLAGSAASLFAANVIATRTLLSAVRAHQCDRFVLVSSIAVYGTGHLSSTSVIDETCPLDPSPHLRDPYTFSKVVQEQVCWSARSGWNLPLVVIRPGNIYGAGRDVLTSRVGIKVGPVMLRMGGRQSLPYTYVDNCADAIVQAGFVEGVEGEAFNVIDDRLPTGRELIEEHRRRVGPVRAVPVPLWALPYVARAYTAYSNYSRGQLPGILTPYRVAASWNNLRYTNAKARAKLHWSCTVNFQQAIDATFASSPGGSRG